MNSLINKKVKLHYCYITSPNAIGVVVKESPKTLTVKIVERTFEEKSNEAFPNQKWDAEHIEWFKVHIEFELKFWKKTMLSFGDGDWLIHEILE